LGAVAFRALTGRLPFEGTNALTLIALKLDREAPSLAATTGDEWPQTIERFLERMMSRDREKRYATARDAHEGWRKVRDTMGDAHTERPRNLVVREEWPDGDRTEITAQTVGGGTFPGR